ncbi:MAG TPA: hypothetical protein VJA45_05580 [Methylomirabilota bacterium]|nr:hypothetical protein [Methylomirabilota bacterium]
MDRRGLGRRMSGRLPALLTALLLAGCATLTPAEEQSVAEIKAFSDRTAELYGLPPLIVLVSYNPRDPAGIYRRGFFAVSSHYLTSDFRDAIVAHELGHYVLGHDAPLRGPGPEDKEREQQQRELDANAKAVEILARVNGVSEERALKTVYLYLLGAHWAVERYPRLDVAGHKPFCEEIADLLSRFPQQRSWTAALECAPARWRTGG